MKLVGFFSQTAVKKNHAGTIAPCTPDGRFDLLASVAEILTPHWFSKFFGFADKSGSKLHDSISIVFLAGAADNITGILPLVISRLLGFAATFWSRLAGNGEIPDVFGRRIQNPFTQSSALSCQK